jgi:DNA polymerase I
MTPTIKENPRLADIVFDTETNGFLDAVSVIHCAVIFNRRTNTSHRYDPSHIAQFYLDLQGHIDMGLVVSAQNGIKYDAPVLQKLAAHYSQPAPYFPQDQFRDTLTLSRLVWPDIKESDTALLKSGKLPGKLWGSHSLKAWGYRLGFLKGEYGEQENAWETYKPEMLDYCEQDVAVTVRLLERIESKLPTPQSVKLEHEVAWLIAKQERNGFPFSEEKARALYMKLVSKRTEIENRLRVWFPPWRIDLEDFVPKVNSKKYGYEKGVAVKKWKDMVFNPGSRDHIAERLITLFGWAPEDFTDGGKPKVDEDTLDGLPYPPVKDLVEYLMVQKRISQVGDGDTAWLKLVKNGHIYGSVNTNGAVTGRATHAYPNVSQVPASYSPYGPECRDCFGPPVGWLLVGADASGLELRCLGHFMAKYDGGAYIKVLLDGDVHTVNMHAAGLDTRDNAKTFIYAYLYGAGDAKIGKIVGGGAAHGKKLKARFLAQTPALKYLKDAVAAAAKRGHIIGIDGRIIPIRSPHAALNTLLQSAGGIVCKQWLVFLEEALQARGLKHGWDGDYAQCAWVHDEVQIACRTPEVAAIVAELAPLMVAKTGEHFKLRCPLAGEAKTGKTWAETH